MRKLFWLLLSMLVLSLACSAQPTAAPAPTTAAQTDGASVTPTLEIATEFTPTDPATVNLAAGKPQLVEFYAVW